MARRSVYTNVTARQSIAPAVHSATVTGTAVDRNVGADMHRTAMVVVSTGVITDGTHTIEVQESDASASGFTAVAAADLQGAEPAVVAADDSKVFFIGYTGSKRYLRVVSTVSGSPATGGAYGALVLLGEPRRGPVSHTST